MIWPFWSTNFWWMDNDLLLGWFDVASMLLRYWFDAGSVYDESTMLQH